MGWKALLAVTAAALSVAASLPQKGPLPAPRPVDSREESPENDKAQSEVQIGPLKPAETPVPKAKPEPKAETDAKDAVTTTNPSEPAKPADETPKPPGGTSEGDNDQPDASSKPQEPETKLRPAEPPPSIEPESEADLKTCMADLQAIGARFETIGRVDDSDGCGMDKPITVDRLLPGVALSPAGDMRCETALQLARWVKHSVMRSAEVGLPGKAGLTSVNHASTYVCRKRNGASDGKISEHARGNAVDIASLSFGRETVPMRIVTPEGSTIEDAFQRAINASACLYFTTVLSPGSDATHQDHMHLDVLKRNGGFRYCR